MMEIYILDSLYRRVQIVDRFFSLIWTERHRDLGDFELILPSTLQNKSLFPVGTNIAMNNSYRVMVVKTSEDSVDTEGKTTYIVRGQSIENILEDRVARDALSDLTSDPKWVITNTPTEICRTIYHNICVTGVLDAGDIISSVAEGSSIFPADTIDEPTDTITVEIDPTTVLNAIKNISAQYDFGFRIVRDPISSLLYFDIYTGVDRTTDQTTSPAVIFSPTFDNLQNIKELTTIQGAKNVAYVFSPVGHRIVYATDVDPTIAGFDRRVVLVKADDITDVVVATANAKMDQRGYEALALARKFSGFDGEISQNSRYKYGIDYNLGDLVEYRNIDGLINQMRVTEQIFVSDAQGERSYPTLSLSEFITPGSWGAYDPTVEWFDLDGSSTHWADQP